MSGIKRKIEDDYMEYGISFEVLETMRQWHEAEARTAGKDWKAALEISVKREHQQIISLNRELNTPEAI